MHKNFYASGFLYHPATSQILLQQQSTEVPSYWSLFGGINIHAEEDSQSIFKIIIHKRLRVRLLLRDVRLVYTYFDEKTNKNHCILYAEVAQKKNFRSKNNVLFSWFTFKQIQKLQLAEQTRHDIIVGQRVIEASIRKRFGQHTLE